VTPLRTLVTMSAQDLREQYAEPWFEYVETVVKILHDGRVRLAAHHPERPDLMHGGSTNSVVQEARTAVDDIVEALAARQQDFTLTMRARRFGPAWDTLRGFFLTTCVAVREVHVTLSLDIATLLDNDMTLPASTPTYNSVHLNPDQRVFLETAWAHLTVLTGNVIIQAITRFATGRHSTSVLS